MDCAQIDLIAYHFGTDSDAERDATEEHLLRCTACLESYLGLKRTREARARTERPSAALRDRLREDVARTFGTKRKRLAWLARPIPLYQGLAAVGLAIAVAWLAPALARRAPTARPGERVDTSLPSAASFSVY